MVGHARETETFSPCVLGGWSSPAPGAGQRLVPRRRPRPRGGCPRLCHHLRPRFALAFRQPRPLCTFGPIRTLGGVAESVENVPCALSASDTCRVAHVKILDGADKGRMTTLTTVAQVGSLAVSKGDRIRVYKNTVPPGAKSVGAVFVCGLRPPGRTALARRRLHRLAAGHRPRPRLKGACRAAWESRRGSSSSSSCQRSCMVPRRSRSRSLGHSRSCS